MQPYLGDQSLVKTTFSFCSEYHCTVQLILRFGTLFRHAFLAQLAAKPLVNAGGCKIVCGRLERYVNN